MKNDKIDNECWKCKWWTIPEYVCTNYKSEHCADFTMPNWCCIYWEGYEDIMNSGEKNET